MPRGAPPPMTSYVGSRRPRVDRDALDRAGGGAHAVAHDAPLEPRPGRARADEQELAVADDDLRVRADVHQQRHPLARVHAGDEHPGERVAADVAADVGQHDDRRRRVRRRAPAPRRARRESGSRPGRTAPGRDGRGRGRAESAPSWCCRPRRRSRSPRPRRPPAAASCAAMAPMARRRQRLEPLEAALVQAQVRAGEDVLAVLDLRVQRGALAERRAGVEVDQRADDVRRAQIDGEPEVPGRARPPARRAAASGPGRARPSRPRRIRPRAGASAGRRRPGAGAWTPLSPRASSPRRTRSRSAA